MPAAKHDICWLGHWTPAGDICRAAFHPLVGYLCGPRPLRARMNALTLPPSWVPRSHRATALTHMHKDRYTVHTHTRAHTRAHTQKCASTCVHTPTHNQTRTRTKAHHLYLANISTQQTASSVNICSSGGCFCFPLTFHHQGLAVKLRCYCCYFNHRPHCNWQLAALSNPQQSLIKYANASWGQSGWTRKTNKLIKRHRRGERAGTQAVGSWKKVMEAEQQ